MMRRQCYTAGRLALPSWAAAQRRGFFGLPMGDSATAGDVPVFAGSPLDSTAASAPAAATYVYPLESADAAFKLYGERADFAPNDANRVFATADPHSYSGSVLYSDLQLQEVGAVAAAAGGLAAPTAPGGAAAIMAQQQQLHPFGFNPLGGGDGAAGAAARAGEDDNEAVMKEGRDKQGAAGAAVVAAAMLETRRGADAGVAMVPGHPLPVVFPKPDGMPPALRFVKKFGPGQSNLSRQRQRQRRHRDGDDEGGAGRLCHGEVMRADGGVEGHSIRRSITVQVRVLDAQKRFQTVRQYRDFRELSDALPDRLIASLADGGYGAPSLLQSAAVPLLMAGRDVVGVAPNGTGKALAFALPSLALVLRLGATGGDTRPAVAGGVVRPLVLALCPTREAVQRVAAVYGGLGRGETAVVAAAEAEALQEGCDVLVATPERCRELTAAGLLRLDAVRFLGVDEAEKIFALGQGAALEETAATIRQQQEEEQPGGGGPSQHHRHQTCVWSAAVTPEVEAFAAAHCAPLVHTVVLRREEETNTNVRQVLYPLAAGKDARLPLIAKLYERRAILKREQVVVYCTFKETAEAVAKALAVALAAPPSLVRCVHSGLRARRRGQILQAFRQAEVRVLVGTDVALRLLAVPDLEHVVHYDLPAATEAFARRCGAVGRGGRKGTAHTLLCAGDPRVPAIARFVQQQTGQPLGPEIERIVADVLGGGGDDDWSVPPVRVTDRAPSHTATTWRVRGRRDRDYERHAIADGGATPEPDVCKKPPPGSADTDNSSSTP